MKFTYLFIDLGAFIIPFIASFHPKLRFHRTWFAFWPANILCGILFLLWDALFTRAGVWGFNEAYITGIYCFNLPLEEVLFFLCIPYACLFSYHCIRVLWLPNDIRWRVSRAIVLLLSGLAPAAVILYHDRIYTLVTALLLLAFLSFILLRRKTWAGLFFVSYGCMLFPFLIVNGLLTGSWIDAPVVWYDPGGIIGARLLTIPVEDIFYGLCMMGLQVAGYEFLLSRSASAVKIPAV